MGFLIKKWFLKDGLNIQISAGFQYQLQSALSDILDLFYLWPWVCHLKIVSLRIPLFSRRRTNPDTAISPSTFSEMLSPTSQPSSLSTIEQVKSAIYFLNIGVFSIFLLIFSVVESNLLTYLEDSLINYHATITNFQLLDVEFPSSFSSAISDTQVFFIFN